MVSQGQTSSSRRALSHSFWPGACWVHKVISWLMLSVTALGTKREEKLKTPESSLPAHPLILCPAAPAPNQAHRSPHLAAAAKRFLALGAPGSTDRDLAARSSLLEAMEMFLRFPMT